MPQVTYREAIRQGLMEALDSDERVFMMGEDIGAYGGSYAVTKGFLERYGEERIKDTPISESVIVGAGIGAAVAGLRPVVEIMTINFSLLAMDQIVNIGAKIRYMSGGQLSVPLVIRTVSGGGNMLAATHSQSLESWYARVPGLKVVTPATPYDALGLFRSALADPNLVLFVEHSLLYGSRGEVPETPYTVPIGAADVKRSGKDVTIVAYLRMVPVALQAAEALAREGIEAEVLDLRSLLPLDAEAIVTSVEKTHRAVVVEETWEFGGFAGEVATLVNERAFDSLDGPVLRVGGANVPMPYSRSLELAAIPDAAAVVKRVKQLF
ncbi:MAG: alpha-ketoacid dehydrogenase subunit beta [Chloroflexi bacterium]|nr:alpha-ketoacid dehydrogenase subunit beta [Chloroflexota bacterium]